MSPPKLVKHNLGQNDANLKSQAAWLAALTAMAEIGLPSQNGIVSQPPAEDSTGTFWARSTFPKFHVLVLSCICPVSSCSHINSLFPQHRTHLLFVCLVSYYFCSNLNVAWTLRTAAGTKKYLLPTSLSEKILRNFLGLLILNICQKYFKMRVFP